MQAVLGRKGDYTVRAVLELARHHGEERRKARQIAAAMDIPERYLTQILAELVRAGLLNAVAGPDGGYSLARPPEAITLLEVVETAEGAIGIDECVLHGGTCDWRNVCPVHPAWSRAQQALKAELEKTTFAELAEIDRAIVAGEFVIPADTPEHATTTRRRGVREN